METNEITFPTVYDRIRVVLKSSVNDVIGNASSCAASAFPYCGLSSYYRACKIAIFQFRGN